MVNFFQALGQRIRPSSIRPRSEAVEQPIDLDRICATTHHGCMGLPQELVDHTMDMLHDDIPALKACSLTCKAMFASTRRLIHQTLHLTLDNTLRILTPKEKRHYEKGNRDVELRFLSFMGVRGFLQYTQRVHICTQYPFTPGILLPHLHHFQSLNRIHTLTIDNFCANEWVDYHATCFGHFYPTLTSLALSHSFGRRGLLNFALRFPNLENLSLEWLKFDLGPERELTNAATSPDRSPPLRGCLRLAANDNVPVRFWVQAFREPPKGLNFRSVELEGIPSSLAQAALNACAQTLEDVTFTNYRFESLGSQCLYLSMPVIRRLTFRATLNPIVLLGYTHSLLITITSPVFCELVLEICGSAPPLEPWRLVSWDGRGKSGYVFEEFSRNGDFRLIIRTSELSDREDLQRQAERAFPLLASRGCIYLETL